MNVDVDPDWDGPGGPAQRRWLRIGAPGRWGSPVRHAMRRGARGRRGLATLAADEFGGGPRMPMVPGSWDPPAASKAGRRLSRAHLEGPAAA